MSLDTEQIHRLRGKKFDQLYADHKGKWDEMVVKATEYAKTYLEGSNERVRPADISSVLQNAMRVDPQFEAFVDKRSLTQKYWVAWFSDFVVEQVYPLPEIK